MINWSDRWPFFTPEEIFSPDQLELFVNKGVCPYSFRSLDKLHDFRRFVDLPLMVNTPQHRRRGSRSLREVHEINLDTRAPAEEWGYSFHLWCAFDITCPILDTLDLYHKALEFKLWGGIGLYPNFIHCDDRDNLTGITTTWRVGA